MQLYVERVTKSVRRRRADAEKAAAEAQHAAGPSNLATAGMPLPLFHTSMQVCNSLDQLTEQAMV